MFPNEHCHDDNVTTAYERIHPHHQRVALAFALALTFAFATLSPFDSTSLCPVVAVIVAVLVGASVSICTDFSL